MNNRHIYALAAVLVAISVALFAYKWRVLGFPITQNEQTQIWKSQRGIDLRNAQRAELEGWGWADRDHHVARIPIDEVLPELWLLSRRNVQLHAPFSEEHIRDLAVLVKQSLDQT